MITGRLGLGRGQGLVAGGRAFAVFEWSRFAFSAGTGQDFGPPALALAVGEGEAERALLQIALALARLCPHACLRGPATAIVHVVRGLPLITFIFWTYFVSPAVIGRPVGGVETLIIALVVYEASYLSEIIRAGIQALPQGQTEAAYSLGLRY